MPTYHRYFILPIAEYEDADGTVGFAPRYVHDNDNLVGYCSGGPFSREQVEDAGYTHLLAHNDAEEWRVAVAWGEDNDGWQELNEIHAMNHDTETLADHGQDVAPVMDDRFGVGEWAIDARSLEGSENTGGG